MSTKLEPQQSMGDAERIGEVVLRLESLYGVPEWRPRQNPLDELIACILSQHTSDVNSLRAFGDLKGAYENWRAVIAASPHDVADTIRRGGLGNSKALRIQEVLRRIVTDFGDTDLSALNSMSDEAARRYLMGLPGVGPKTAAIVLCFAMGRNVMPVDTHIFRVSWRLGFISKRVGEARAHDILQAMVPAELTYRYHVALITHGRTVCRAPVPRCTRCVLSDICWWYNNESRQSSGD